MLWEIKTLTKQQHAELRRLLEEHEVTSVSDDLREYVELQMPDLVDRLPARVLH